MARVIHKLNDAKIKSHKRQGRLSDGGGLYLRISKAGTKSWSYIWKKGEGRYELGLGGYPALSLAEARKIAKSHRELIALGGSPIDEKRRAREENDFATCVSNFLEKQTFRSEKHRKQWEMTLGPTYCARLQKKRPSEITQADVLAVLDPIWHSKNETASRLRSRIQRVLDFARPPQGWKQEINPATWTGYLEHKLTAKREVRKLSPIRHHPAMPYKDVPSFMTELRARHSLSARALELLIFSACRTGEVLKAKWSEINFDERLWTIPAARMKMRREHIVPLTDPTYELLLTLYEHHRNDWIFPGQKRDKPLSDMVLEMQMRRMGLRRFTPHGFRSSFRDWAGDETEFAREIAEGCLAHKIGDDTENAYRRGTAIKKRCSLLTAWANYLTGASGEVVQINQYAG